MEVWWASFIASPSRLAALVAFTFLLLLGYNRFAGLRHDASWLEVAIDSVEELGLGILTAAGILFLIGRIGGSMPREEIVAKIAVEAVVVAIGFSVGSAQLGSSGEDTGKGSGPEQKNPTLWQQIVMGMCGAILLGANVAPTEEIVMIAVETSPLRLAGVALLSFALCGSVLHFMDFKGADRRAAASHHVDVIAGTAITFAVGIVTAAVLLWFFGRFAGMDPGVIARQVVVLALPAALGAAAGRLLLQS
jgi:putative integral membrane protein (TIGR02587 family)